MATIRIDPPSFLHSKNKTIFSKKLLIQANGYYDTKSLKIFCQTLQEKIKIMELIEKDLNNLDEDEILNYRKNHEELFEKDYIL